MSLITEKNLYELSTLFDDIQDKSIKQELVIEFTVKDQSYIDGDFEDDIDAVKERIRDLLHLECSVIPPHPVKHNTKVKFIIREQ